MTPDLVERVAQAIADASNNLGANPLPHLHHTSILVETMARAATAIVLDEAAKVAEDARNGAAALRDAAREAKDREGAVIHAASAVEAGMILLAIRALKGDE